jgi:hypothetical protein
MDRDLRDTGAEKEKGEAGHWAIESSLKRAGWLSQRAAGGFVVAVFGE